MKSIKRLPLSLAAVLIFSAVAMVSPALAEQGVSDQRSISPSPPTPVSTTSDSQGSSDENGLNQQDMTRKFKENAQAKIEAEKQTVKEKSQTERENACDNRKSSIQNRMDGVVSKAQAYQTRFDNIFTKAKAYHDKNGLNVTDYDSLVAAITTDQQNVQTAISALKGLNVTIDCATPDNAVTTVSSFREAVKTVRDDLKQYRTDLIKLLVALKVSASTGNTPTNNTGGQ